MERHPGGCIKGREEDLEGKGEQRTPSELQVSAVSKSRVERKKLDYDASVIWGCTSKPVQES